MPSPDFICEDNECPSSVETASVTYSFLPLPLTGAFILTPSSSFATPAAAAATIFLSFLASSMIASITPPSLPSDAISPLLVPLQSVKAAFLFSSAAMSTFAARTAVNEALSLPFDNDSDNASASAAAFISFSFPSRLMCTTRTTDKPSAPFLPFTAPAISCSWSCVPSSKPAVSTLTRTTVSSDASSSSSSSSSLHVPALLLAKGSALILNSISLSPPSSSSSSDSD